MCLGLVRQPDRVSMATPIYWIIGIGGLSKESARASIKK